jgi:hypothetical protein
VLILPVVMAFSQVRSVLSIGLTGCDGGLGSKSAPRWLPEHGVLPCVALAACHRPATAALRDRERSCYVVPGRAAQ